MASSNNSRYTSFGKKEKQSESSELTECANFLQLQWNRCEKHCKENGGILFYKEKQPASKPIVPFNLEAWLLRQKSWDKTNK